MFPLRSFIHGLRSCGSHILLGFAKFSGRLSLVAITSLVTLVSTVAAADPPTAAPEIVRCATYNVSMYRRASGALASDLAGEQTSIRKIAAVLQIVRPHIVLLNEFDWDEKQEAVTRFRDRYLREASDGREPIDYPYFFSHPVNTGLATGLDLNGNGRTSDPQDAHGFGRFEGQYGMLVLSQFPIAQDQVRTFQKFLWKDLPNAQWPRRPDSGQFYYSERARDRLRLSSKSHWDVPIQIGTRQLHFLTCHPTPPVFDGDEDRNGLRNDDEIRFWQFYVEAGDAADFIYDDRGQRGGLASGHPFVIAGDLNADPQDGDSRRSAIRSLLAHPGIAAEPVPTSVGGSEQARLQAGVNRNHKGDPGHDTADFSDRTGASGNLRIDYVLPSANFTIHEAGIFWPATSSPHFPLIDASDHRLVWVDISW